MRNITIVVASITLLCSCVPKNGDNTKLSDSISKDSQTEEDIRSYYISLRWDTVGVSESGVIVTDAEFLNIDGSEFRSVKINYRNLSGKDIKAIKFRWYGLNAFQEPAECGDNKIGFGSGYTDEMLNNNQSKTSIWEVFSVDGDSVVMAWPREIIFTDGTRWKSQSSPEL